MLSAFASWLVSLFNYLIDSLYEGTINAINAIISGVGAAIAFVVGLLPDMGAYNFTPPVSAPGQQDFLGFINWLLPVNHLVSSISLYVAAIILYFAMAPVLRWFKVVR